MKIECNICGQIFDECDPEFLGLRCDRHTLGRHLHHSVEGRDGSIISKSGMGGLILSNNVEWITLN